MRDVSIHATADDIFWGQFCSESVFLSELAKRNLTLKELWRTSVLTAQDRFESDHGIRPLVAGYCDLFAFTCFNTAESTWAGLSPVDPPTNSVLQKESLPFGSFLQDALKHKLRSADGFHDTAVCGIRMRRRAATNRIATKSIHDNNTLSVLQP